MSPIGQYLGGTFNFVFFILSGILIGLNSNSTINTTKSKSRVSFLRKRILRLIPDLWIFLLAFTLYAYFVGISINPKTVMLNFMMLGWIAKLPNCGHLWFVSMILICYTVFSFLLYTENKKRATIVVFTECILGQLIFEYLNLPSYLFIILLISCIGMLYSHQITQLFDYIPISWATFFLLVTNVPFLIMIYSKNLIIGHLNYYYIACICGTSVLLFLYKFFKHAPVGRILMIISLYSYQIYLVHHPLCNVTGIAEKVNSKTLAIIIILTATIILSALLKWCSDFFTSTIYGHLRKRR